MSGGDGRSVGIGNELELLLSGMLRRILYEPQPFMRRDQVFFGTPITRSRNPWRTLHHEVQDFEQALSHRDVTLVTGLVECQRYPVGQASCVARRPLLTM
jgi:hypothetical protein